MSYDYVSLHPPYRQIFDSNQIRRYFDRQSETDYDYPRSRCKYSLKELSCNFPG